MKTDAIEKLILWAMANHVGTSGADQANMARDQLAALLAENEALMKDKERLELLASVVLDGPSGQIDSWRVHEFIGPMMFGATLREAIDRVAAQEAERKSNPSSEAREK